MCCVLCTERQDEVVYYDAYESPDALQATDDTSLALAPLRDEVTQLQQRTRQLEARRGRITAKKAYLKTKKVRNRMQHTHSRCCRLVAEQSKK